MAWRGRKDGEEMECLDWGQLEKWAAELEVLREVEGALEGEIRGWSGESRGVC